ncbi:hypothetical protein DPMN_117972 [Dreissena polymorpha]|uniref:EGF-like domain-containing protein n=1 Tax=Dreissena polymorpha TaxID=45954 RepID=A0A9D4JL90_DREPO|nr:hypothetical protein DPMN_117972 [Dreissena polymorpha]
MCQTVLETQIALARASVTPAGDIPVCSCYPGYMGNECEYRCVNGTATKSHECVCDPCFTGGACDEVCTGQGSCVNDTCVCSPRFWGELSVGVFIEILG